MRCTRANSLIERFIDGRLEGREARRFQRHTSTCARCAAWMEAARKIAGTFAARPAIHAPPDLLDAVMADVYREALRGSRGREPVSENQGMGRGRVVPAAIYRRLGLSFLLTAAILTVSLLIPSAAYSSIIGAQVQASQADVPVKRIVDGAGAAVRIALHPQNEYESGANGGSER